ncbi:MAG: hypothetical protein HYZ53_27490 [Planctomycetes bacterium]|nr:hypothetical protein [Planctomycetota bacterium]
MPTAFPVEAARAAFEAERYLDAHAAIGPAWTREALLSLDVDGKLFAGRLAFRLGSPRVGRWLHRAAEREAPSHPAARYYALLYRWERRGVWWALRYFREHPELPGADDETLASWLMVRATLAAFVRDFTACRALTARALALAPRDAWIRVEHCRVLACEDRWEEALAAAETALELRPGYANAQLAVSAQLWQLGRPDEALTRAGEAADGSQVFALHMSHAGLLLSKAALLDGDERREWGGRAVAATRVAWASAPLADREVIALLNGLLADAHYAAGEKEAFRERAAKTGSPFFQAVLAQQEREPDGRRVVVPHRPVYQHHNTCLPASLATVLSAAGTEADHEALVAELTYSGTPTHAVRPWAQRRGLAVREFVADAHGLRALISAGFACILSSEFGDSSHARAVIGMDFARGTILFHDPGLLGVTEAVADAFCRLEAPLGPIGVALAPGARRAELDALPLAASEPVRRLLEVQRIQAEGRFSAAEAVAREAAAAWPEEPIATFTRAQAALAAGDPRTAYALGRELLARMPTVTRAQNLVLSAAEGLHNPAEAQRVLEALVAGRPLEGVLPHEAPRHADPQYAVRLADYLRRNAAHAGRARRLLEEALRANPSGAHAFHCLGDLLWDAGEKNDSLLALATASHTDAAHDHYATAYADLARELGREAEGLAWMEERVRTLGARREGHRVWSGWIDALSRFGRPEEADRALEQALAARPEDGELAAFAAGFRAQQGGFDAARSLLAVAARNASPVEARRAAWEVADREGRHDEAWTHVLAWCEAAPGSLEAWRCRARMLAGREGPGAAAGLTASLCERFPGDEHFDSLHLEWLHQSGQLDLWMARLRKRIERNPDDAWGWRELAFELADRAARERGAAAEAARGEALACLAEAKRTDPEGLATLCLEGRIALVGGDRAAARAVLTRAFADAPDCEPALQGLFGAVAGAPAGEVAEVARRAEELVLLAPAHRGAVACLADRLRDALGPEAAEAFVERVVAARPPTPELAAVRAEVRLQAGAGRAGAERAVEVLRPALARFPDDVRLRALLARTLFELGDAPGAAGHFREALARVPCYSYARRQLALALAAAQDPEGALEQLRLAARLDPLGTENLLAYARELRARGKAEAAIAELEEAVRRDPDLFVAWELLAEYRSASTGPGAGVEVARRCVAARPESSRAHHALACALAGGGGGGGATPEEVVAAFRRALALDAGNFDASDELCVFLSRQGRHDEALAECDRAIASRPAPMTAEGRRAWVLHERGRKAEAVEAMKVVLGRYPDYRWGWLNCLEWLGEAGRDEEAVRISAGIGPAASPDLGVRLRVLERLGECRPAAEVDAAWERLAADFPDVEEVAARYADRLLEAKRPKPAASLLERARRANPASSYLLARQVRADLALGSTATALARAAELFRNLGDGNPWPSRHVWERFQEHRETGALLAQTLAEVRAGARLEKHAVRGLVHALVEAKQGKVVGELVTRFLEGGQADESLCSDTLERWVETISAERFAEWRKANEARCRGSLPLWQVTGWALNRNRAHALCIEWLGDWRSRSAVAQWALYNLADSLGEGGRWKEALQVHQEALAGCAWDHSADRHRAMSVAYRLLAGEWAELARLLEGLKEEALGDGVERLAVELARALPELTGCAESGAAAPPAEGAATAARTTGGEAKALAAVVRLRRRAAEELRRDRALLASRRFDGLCKLIQTLPRAQVTSWFGRLRLWCGKLTSGGWWAG